MNTSQYVSLQRYTMWGIVALCLLVVLLFESGIIDPFDVFTPHVGFFVATIMELLTIAVIPFALRFMKFGFVSRRIKNASTQQAAITECHKLSLVRLLMLCDLMLVNTLLYYISALTVAYGYMAIILLISLGFVYPSTSRFNYECGLTETEKP